MADVPGKFYRATKVRTGVSPSSAGSIEGEVLPPVNPPGSSLNSVGLTMPSAFTVSNSPLTANGTIGVAGAGTVGQYIRGDGSLADFPQSSGGGSSVSYYLNGSVDQGTIGGIAYKELSKVPILGAGTDFSINADGYIASFITDAGDPSLLEIPGGNWNFETYFSASSSGGTPTFYVELYKVSSGGTATLIASSSSSPELIAFGTNLNPYFSTLAVPTTTLALTDRLAVRYYVTHSGRTITLHTENNHLCQIVTTFTTGITALNGLTAQVQNFAIGTTGTDFNIASATATHTFNLPSASATNRGALSSADWSLFTQAYNDKINSASVTGTTTKTLTLTQQDGGTITASWSDLNTDAVLSVFGRTGAVVAANGDYTTAQVTESGNLYYTDARSRAALSFAAGSGAYNTSTGVITIPTNNNQITNGAGYITSAALAGYLPLSGGVMTGPITTPNNTFGIVIGDDSRLADRNIANTLFVEGNQNNDRGYINFSQTSGNDLGAINGGNLTWRGNTVWHSGNINPVTSVTASNPLASSGGTTPNITIQQASGSQSGFLSSTDWTTFNNKQNALTNPVTGTGTTNYLPKFTGSTTIGDSALFDNNVIVSITNREFRIIDNEPQIYLTKTGTDAGIWRILGSTGGTTRRFRIYDETASADRLNITSGGNVLINSISDNGARLQVSGDVRISGVSEYLRSVQTSTSAQFQSWFASDGTTRRAILGFRSGGSDNFTLLNERNGSMFIGTNDATNLTISSTGAATFSSNVAAGSTSSGAQINVFASSYGNNGLFNAYGTDNFIKLQMGALGTNEGFIFTGSGNKISFFSGGNLALTLNSNQTATFSSSVDASLFSGNLTVGSATVGGQVKLDYGANAASRSWRLVSDAYNYGDFSIQQSTTQAGSTYSDKFLISATGNVGIGTASPNANLEIATANSLGSFARFRLNAPYYNYWEFLNNSALEINRGGSTHLTISNVGNLLVGTTSDNGARLQVSGNVYIARSSNPYLTIDDTGVSSEGGILFKPSGYNSKGGLTINYSTAEQRLFVGEGGNSYFQTFYTNGSPRMTITSSGSVGIGTPSPAALTEINPGNITNGGAAKFALAIRSGSTTYLDFYQGWNSTIAGQSILGTTLVSSDALAFASSGVERMRITLGGNVGIGTPSPSCLFQARGSDSLSANSRNLKAHIGGAGTWGSNSFEELGVGYSGIRSTYTSGDNWDLSFSTGTSTTFVAGTQPERMRITSSGNVGIATPSPQRRLHVLNSAVNNDLQLRLEGNGGNYFDLGRFRDTGAFHIQGNQTGANNICLAPTSGNVLIGTTTDNGAMLQVNGGATLNGNLRIIASNGFNDSINLDRTYSNAMILNSSGNLILNGTTGSSRLTCYGNGYFSSNLETGGDILVRGSYNPYASTNRGNITLNGTSSNILAFTNNSAGRGYILHNGTDMEVQNVSSGTIRFFVASGEAFRVNSGRSILTYADLAVGGKINGFDLTTLAPTGTNFIEWRLGRALVATSVETEDRWIRVQLGNRIYDILAIDRGLA